MLTMVLEEPASDQMAWADMRELANEYNLWLVYPQGTPLDGVSHWNQHCRWDNRAQQMILDLFALIENLSSTYSIDSDRIYASYSNGFMSYSLVCYHSEVLGYWCRSFHNAQRFGRRLQSNASVPIISLNGTSDSVVPYEGGSAGYQAIPMLLIIG